LAALSLISLAGAAHVARSDVSSFTGTWIFAPGSKTMASCPEAGTLATVLGGDRVSIYPGTTSDLIFDIGCHCRVGINLVGAGARIAGPQQCRLVNKAVPISGTVDVLTLEPAQTEGALSFTLAGSNAQVTLSGTACSAGPFSGSGELTRSDAPILNCGDPSTAVGVLPYEPGGIANCVVSAGREGLQIVMHDEDTPAGSDQTGYDGEGPWVLPDDTRLRAPGTKRASSRTALDFCRVDGALFRPLTTGADPGQFYAVLKLGDRCPSGSVEVSKTIDNEDRPGDTPNLVLGDPGPNTVLGDPQTGTLTTLIFCYFRAAAPGEGVMGTFPDLGFPYAVYHRYSGEQPSWVIAKRWQFSDDEDTQQAADMYQGADSSILSDFEDIIENPQNDTFFNMARVR